MTHCRPSCIMLSNSKLMKLMVAKEATEILPSTTQTSSRCKRKPRKPEFRCQSSSHLMASTLRCSLKAISRHTSCRQRTHQQAIIRHTTTIVFPISLHHPSFTAQGTAMMRTPRKTMGLLRSLDKKGCPCLHRGQKVQSSSLHPKTTPCSWN